MSFQPRTLMFRAVLFLGITAASAVTASVHAAPVLNRLQEADPMAVPAQTEFRMPSFQLMPVSEATVAIPAPVVKPTVASPAASSLAQRMREQATGVVNTALNFLGMPYRHGGTSESTGFDCSGFTRYMFEMSVGLVLPRLADQQAKAPGLTAIKRDELQPGDLVFFNTLRRTFSHVGIYIGDGKFVHAPKPGAEVRVEDMGVAYWANRFTGARRADPDVDPMAGQSMASPQPMTASIAMPTTLARAAVAIRHNPVHRQVRRRHR